MAEIITMPRLSDTMEEGTVSKWLVKIGDRINEGDILAEIETDKATMEFESFYSGTLLHIGIKENETAKIDSLLAIIGDQGEDITPLLTQSETKTTVDNTSQKESSEVVSNSNQEEISHSDKDKGKYHLVTMPRLSDTMEEGTLATWLKKEGDAIKEGDILAEIETDKATMEFESFYSGKLLYTGLKQGESVPVDTLIAIIGEDGVDVQSILNNKNNTSLDGITKNNTNQETKSTTEPKHNTTENNTVNTNDRIKASPLAKRIAKDKGVDLSQIKGSGEQGRIIKQDLEQIKNINTSKPSEKSTIQHSISNGGLIEHFEDFPNSQMRKTIAKKLSESKFTAPHFYLMIEVDMDNAIRFRSEINTDDVKISFNDIVLKACSMTLKKHPKINSSWQNESIRRYDHIHVGVAVAIDDGLVVPVLRFADTLKLTDIGKQVKILAERSRNKKLTPADMEGSTFTVSNLGMFGITEFTSIINQPNATILSVGTIVKKPVVKNNEICIGNTMKLTLTCDHRTVDGATGAMFLNDLKCYIENPLKMLI